MARPVIPRFTPAEATIGFAALQIAAKKVGTPRKLCAQLGISEQSIAQWKARSQPIPMHLVPLVVEIAKNPLVTPYTLRPDLWRVWMMLGRQLAGYGVLAAEMLLPQPAGNQPAAQGLTGFGESARDAQVPV